MRSSATAEDLPEAAFAGQQETFLGILDEKALLAAVRRCWASLWTERAIAYRNHLGIDHADVKLAVVVQRLVAAEAAGVLFTANPVSGARDEIVIDATSGLGESIVAGLVTPDQVSLRRGRLGWRIVERRRGRREVEIRPRAGGGTEQVVPAASHEPAMADAAYRRLARLGEAIARHFGLPQDIEWAWADGEAIHPAGAADHGPARTCRPPRRLLRHASRSRRVHAGAPLPARRDHLDARHGQRPDADAPPRRRCAAARPVVDRGGRRHQPASPAFPVCAPASISCWRR